MTDKRLVNLDLRFSILAFLWFLGLIILVVLGGYSALGGSDVNALIMPRQEASAISRFEFTPATSDAWIPLPWSSVVVNLQSQIVELGDALDAENSELASYRVGGIETLLGISPVGWSSTSPRLLALRRALEVRDWVRADLAYREFVALCAICAIPVTTISTGSQLAAGPDQ